MRVCVGHTPEDRMILEQSLEPVEIYAHRQDQQQEGKRDGKTAPRQRDGAAETPSEHTASARDENKEDGEQTTDHGEREQPAGDELPRGQGKQKEVQRLAKNRVQDASGSAGCVPKER